jgi:hypothetical protein
MNSGLISASPSLQPPRLSGPLASSSPAVISAMSAMHAYSHSATTPFGLYASSPSLGLGIGSSGSSGSFGGSSGGLGHGLGGPPALVRTTSYPLPTSMQMLERQSSASYAGPLTDAGSSNSSNSSVGSAPSLRRLDSLTAAISSAQSASDEQAAKRQKSARAK